MKLARFVRSDRGAAMVEMALVLPILILLFLGMVDFGRALVLYNNLANAAREGARYGSAMVNPDTVLIRQRVELRIQDFSGAAPVTGKVRVIAALPDPPMITVRIVNYPFSPITPLPMVQGLQLTTSAVFRWEGAP